MTTPPASTPGTSSEPGPAAGAPAAPPESVRVLAVDDHPVVVRGVLALVASQAPEIGVVGAAATWAEAQEILAGLDHPVDLVLMDLRLDDGTRPEDRIATLTREGVLVVVLTAEVRPVAIRRAMEAGAHGLILKSDPVERIVDVVRSAVQGRWSVSSELAFVLVSDPAAAVRLPPRELEALSLLADGIPRKRIGALMNPPVATSTVITYLNRACERYRDAGVDVALPGDAVRAAFADGHLDVPRRQQPGPRPH